VVYVQKNERGEMRGDGINDRISLALTDATYADVVNRGILSQRRVPRWTGAVSLRVVVRDAGRGSTGSVTIPFSQVPPNK
jgi:hypothetical protein